jgi:hypothetical protein
MRASRKSKHKERVCDSMQKFSKRGELGIYGGSSEKIVEQISFIYELLGNPLDQIN